MKTKWDYTTLAKAYLKRPDYSDSAIDKMVETAQLKARDKVCDVGAGVAHLTLKLVDRGLKVNAVEPNDEMRKYGRERTASMGVEWTEGTGEETAQESSAFKMVTFGSSFNVTDREATLKEVKRIALDNGWFAAMWNHRNLEDPIQEQIENIIKDTIDNYDYGSRREDQSAVIQQSGLFDEVIKIEGTVMHTQSVSEVVEAWRSHATLHRQAGDKFEDIIEGISQLLEKMNVNSIDIPYTTRIWMAQLK